MLRWLILGYLAFTVAVLGLKFSLQATSLERATALEEQQQATRMATRDANALLVLTQEFMLRGTPRAATQWQTAYGSLVSAVDAAYPVKGSDEDFNELSEVLRNLPTLFQSLRPSAIDSAAGTEESRRAMLVDQILSETRLLSDAAFRRDSTLLGQLRQEAQRGRTQDGMLNWVLLAASLFVAWLLLARVLRPVALLGATARSVQAGDLQARCSYDRGDELGALAGSFNAMTEALAERQQKVMEANRKVRDGEAFLERVGEVSGVGGWQYEIGPGRMVWADQTRRIVEAPEGYEPTLDGALALYPPDARRRIGQAIELAIRTGQPFDLELDFQTMKGRALWVRTVGMVEMDGDGPDARPLRIVGAFQDITERVQMGQALGRSNERLALALGSAGMGVWDYDLQAGTLTWDDQMFALYGHARTGDVEPFALWTSSLHPGDRTASEQAFSDAISGKKPFDTQFRISRADGSLRHLKAAAHVIRDATGTPLRMIGVNVDVTEQVTTSAELQDTAKLLQRVGRLAAIGGWRVDLNAGTVYWDEQTRRIHEVPPDYVPNLATAIDFYAPEHRAVISQAVQSSEPWDLELRLITFTGRSIWVRALGEMGYENGQAAYLVGAFQDITERRRVAQALQEAKVAAESASAAKSAFLANMSHEIRTPLNAVIGVTHLLADSSLDADQQHLVAKAQMAGRSLLGIVNDVLDLTKIEAGEMALDEVLFEPAELLSELEAVYGAQAHIKGLTLSVQAAPEVPAWLVGDSTRLRQILTNLIGNALKFTDHGSVQANLSVTELSAQRAHLRLTVRDTGIGISPDVQARLFQPFAQADVSTTRRFGGTGLGLSIVRRLAQLMGGEVGLNSVAGEGCEFWVELPMAVPSAEQQSAANSSMLEVVVVDDNVDDRLAMAAMTRALGWRVTLLESGVELVNQMAHRVRVREAMPDALIVDWQMPGMDGLRALQALSDGIGNERLPAALVVSAYERAAIVARDHEHLVDQILTKPVGVSELFNAVNSGVARHSGSTAKVMQSTRLDTLHGQWLPGVRVLVVDDSDINLEVAKRLLERDGAQVQTCGNGSLAVDRLREGGADFDVVLMDVQMPVMDGLAATRLVRGALGLHDLPVVALTAGALTEERKRALAAGMNEFLSKPLDPQALVRTIRRLVESRRGRALPMAPASQAERTRRATPQQHAWPTVEGIDVAGASSRLRDDWPLFVSILRRLVSDYDDLMAPPPSEGDEAWRQALASRVHKLRGSAGTVSANQVLGLAGAAESALRTPGVAALPLLQPLAQALRALQAAAAPVLAAQASAQPDISTDDSAQTLNAAQLEELADLLRSSDLAALERITQWAPALRASLGATTAAQFHAAAQALDFESAARLLAHQA